MPHVWAAEFTNQVMFRFMQYLKTLTCHICHRLSFHSHQGTHIGMTKQHNGIRYRYHLRKEDKGEEQHQQPNERETREYRNMRRKFAARLYSERVTNVAHLFWNATKGSCMRSLQTIVAPLAVTLGCLRTTSQPMCEKKNPRRELYGSASVSVNLWCNRWSLTHL